MKIAIGPVFDEFGGVSQHIKGIEKYSSHKIKIIPSKFERKFISKKAKRTNYYKHYMDKTGLRHYDIVHSHMEPWFTKLSKTSRSLNCKWVHTYHMFYFPEDFGGSLKPWQVEYNRTITDVASKADIKIVVSKWLQEYLDENYSIQTKHIPNGLDLENCEKADSNRFIQKYDLKDFILYTGSIQTRKNPKIFVELATMFPEKNFVMTGRGLSPNNLKKEYNVTIPKNLNVLGEINYDDVLDAVSACKAFVMTTTREGLPTALLEAMALGKTVIASDVPGCNEAIISEEHGFLYEPDSLDNLAEKMNKALESKHIGERAVKRVSDNYDWRILAKKIDSVYESLM